MITKELAKELLEDLGYTVSNPLQFIQFQKVDSQSEEGLVFVGCSMLVSVSGILTNTNSLVFTTRNNDIATLQGGSIQPSITLVSYPQTSQWFNVWETAKYEQTQEVGGWNFYGYRMKI